MSTKKSRSPQEKKTLSYVKDRRNVYRENSKASRKSIPGRKRDAVKSKRRLEHQALAVTGSVFSEDQLVAAEVKARDKGAGRWHKVPDEPLGEIIKEKLARRKRTGMVDA